MCNKNTEIKIGGLNPDNRPAYIEKGKAVCILYSQDET